MRTPPKYPHSILHLKNMLHIITLFVSYAFNVDFM